MTLSSLLAELYRRLNHPTSPASSVSTRLTALVNEGQQELISLPGMGTWITQHNPPLTFASVANRAIYSLPQGVSRIEAIRDATNKRSLSAQSREWYHSTEPDPSTFTGTPEAWVPYGWSAVEKPPADASQLYVKSTSASDTGTCYVEVIRSGGGQPITLSVAMTGVTAVTLSASVTDVVEITKFYVSQSAAGSITLHEDSGSGTELGKITQGQTSARYQQIALWPTPSAVWTYTVDGERDLPDLSNSNDEPLIPSRFHRLLVDYALWKEFEKIDDTRGQQAYGRWQNGVSQLKYFLTCPPDFLPISGKSQALGRSRLGPYYPKD